MKEIADILYERIPEGVENLKLEFYVEDEFGAYAKTKSEMKEKFEEKVGNVSVKINTY